MEATRRATVTRAGVRPRARKHATEQPGNSFRYLYWRLSEKEFQQLCSALLRLKFDKVQCFPVGMADDGIDAIVNGSTIYQVKWSSKLEQNPHTWLVNAIKGERTKIERLVREKHISRYILMTSVAGTTGQEDSGSVQKLDAELAKLSKELKVPIECWWQADMDAEVDNAPDSTKWAYQEMLAGSEAIRYLIYGAQAAGEAARMRDILIQVIATQWGEDAKVKFSQLELDNVNLTDLFVDVQANLVEPPRGAKEALFSTQNFKSSGSLGAVQHLLRTTVPLTFLLGVPGQGKSTLGQYLSQIHRAAILPDDRQVPPENVKDPKLPLRIDLKDYATWVSGRDPFGDEDNPSKTPKQRGRASRSLEQFLAEFCHVKSGGRAVSVDDVHGLLERYPVLLVLDGLDEVAEPELRAVVATEIDATARRMGAVSRVRQFQILVTSRPNATGLAEPDKEIFQTLRLEPLSPALQDKFVNKWCAVSGIDGSKRKQLRRTFHDRRAHDHVAQLADNPMQLTILLHLIKKKGDAVPVARTPLYTDYMETLLDREVDRKLIDRSQVDRVKEVTSFLGWHMHSGVEVKQSVGRLTKKQIVGDLLVYFHQTEGPTEQAEALFAAASDRFWALTSKVDGTFEFAVQPVREYFAAKYLAEWAGRDRREPLPKQAILGALIERNYWLNTARFYAGFASPNELAGLRYGLEDTVNGGRHPLQARVAIWTLLADGIFVNTTPVQRDVTRLLADDLSVVLLAEKLSTDSTVQTLTPGSGGKQLADELIAKIASDPGSPLTNARVAFVRDRLPAATNAFREQWRHSLGDHVGRGTETAWLRVGETLGAPRLMGTEGSVISLANPAEVQAALGVGYSPTHGSQAEAELLRAVLDGWCSDVHTSSSSEAGGLLRVMRPQWYHQLSEGHRTPPKVATGHLWIEESDRSRRGAPWSRLIERDSRYEALKKASNPQAARKKGTTEPWHLAARELTAIHGPSWLASEIAIAGAASNNTLSSGTINRGGEAFGPHVDYGTFIVEVHRHPDIAWWQTMFDSYPDELSRRTWALAMLATAKDSVIEAHLDRLDTVVTSLDDSQFYALAASSSRLGLTQTYRRTDAKTWQTITDRSARLQLLAAHFTANLNQLDALEPLSSQQLRALAGVGPERWPILRAVSSRLLRQPNDDLIAALAEFGPNAAVDIPVDASPIPAQYIDQLLVAPASFPAAWIVAAEQWRSLTTAETPLEEVAIEQAWVPKVPHL